MPRGRPSISLVRERLKEILFFTGEITAYDAHKHYINLFAKTSQRNVYYQLRKGVDKGDFVVDVKNESGDFSWGDTTRKVYYSLASKEGVTIDKRLQRYFQGLKK